MRIKKRAFQAAKWTATGVLTVGVIISIGLLSYFGMLAIAPSIVLGWIAFSLAGIVDGQVYLQNIANGIDNLALLGKKGLSMLIVKSLDKRLDKQIKENKKDGLPPYAMMDAFAKEYCQLRAYVDSFSGKKLTRHQKKDRDHAAKRLARMQKYVVACVLSKTPIDDEPNVAASIRHDELPTLKRKIWYLRFAAPISIIAGFGFGLATAAALDAALIGIAAALSVAVWPLAALACIGYAFLIYHTVSDMICNDTLQKWGKKFIGWFKRGNEQHNLKGNLIYALRIAGTALLLTVVVGTGILATLATAGTWWLAVKNGALLITTLAPVVSAIQGILVPIASTTTLVFAIRNSFESVKKIIKDCKEMSKKAGKAIKDFHLKEFLDKKNDQLDDYFENTPTSEILQTLNPFRLLAKLIALPLRFIIFVGHLIAVGLTGDRAPGLNYEATVASAAVGAVSDAFVDYHYVAKADPHKKHDHHDHQHSLIPKLAIALILSPLFILAAIWDYTVTQSYKKPHPIKALVKAFKHSFGLEEHPTYDANAIKKPVSSSEWLNHEIALRFAKHEKQAPKDKNTLSELKSHVAKKINDPNYQLPKMNSRFHKSDARLFARKITDEYFPEQRQKRMLQARS